MQVWSGMEYKSSLLSFASKGKGFDPLFARWSRAGMLALGMADGGFAVWDSISQQIFASHRTGKHRSGVTAGDWIASLFSPCLALASTSTIKVSQGFDGVEWPATAMKLKLPTAANADRGRSTPLSPAKLLRRASSSSDADVDGLGFLHLGFSSSGKYLAALAAPTTAPEMKQARPREIGAICTRDRCEIGARCARDRCEIGARCTPSLWRRWSCTKYATSVTRSRPSARSSPPRPTACPSSSHGSTLRTRSSSSVRSDDDRLMTV